MCILNKYNMNDDKIHYIVNYSKCIHEKWNNIFLCTSSNNSKQKRKQKERQAMVYNSVTNLHYYSFLQVCVKNFFHFMNDCNQAMEIFSKLKRKEKFVGIFSSSTENET